MLTILLNARIDRSEKFQHLRQTVNSSLPISNDWLVNIRGKYRQKALRFLTRKLQDKMQAFSLLDDDRGWQKNSLDMLNKSRNRYILIMNVDHINIAPCIKHRKIISEMAKNGIDYLPCSWWHFGKFRQAFDGVRNLKTGANIDHIKLTRKAWVEVLANGHDYYLISMVGIFRKNFLKKILSDNSWTFPIKFTFALFALHKALAKVGIRTGEQVFFQKMNSLFRFRLKKYPVSTPFEMEKGPERVDILPINYGVPKYELFACLDDDLGVPGYGLAKRKFYKK
jgi:hypothetical protein